MVKGTTRLVGLIGDPVAHSLSPLMHNSAFQAMQMDWAYVPLHVRPANLRDALRGIYSLGFLGVNVTVPHKEKALPFLDGLSDEAERIRAVNSIRVVEGRFLGDNTDWSGFLRDLAETRFDPRGSRALILGSGGSARAIAYALLSEGAAVTICGRDLVTLTELVAHFRKLFPGKLREPLTHERLHDLRVEADIIVNTTPLGMAPHNGLSPWPEGVAFPECDLVYDLVYNPPKTRFIELAEANGVKAVNGLGMLIHQAALAFEIWTGASAPLEIMRKAVTAC
jgi:shikimate dehydrogenase